MAAGSVIGAFGLVVFSIADATWQVFVVWCAVLGPAMAMTLYEPAYVAVQQWFPPAGRPRAIAVMTLAAGLSGPIAIPATGALVGTLGWRSTSQVLAALLGTLGVTAALAGIPRGRGLGESEPGTEVAPWSEQLRAFTRPRLLVFTLGAVLAYGALEATVIHRIARFEETGFDVVTVTQWAAISGILTLPGRFLLPVLGRRFAATGPLAAVFAVLALASAFMVTGDKTWHMVTYFTLFGLVFGAALPLRAVVMSQWHEIAGFGAIMGLQSLFISLARATGPPLVGGLRQATGGYAVAILILTILYAVGAALVLASGRLEPDA